MKFASHPFWLAGFRPFFALACLAGIALPASWALIYAGLLAPPQTTATMFQWHAHEMFFGFGWAMLGGFLLTSTKNWVGIRGYHGWPLALLAAAWLLERIAMWFGASWPAPLFVLSSFGFLVAIVAMLMWTLIRHHSTDSYRDNFIFLIVLPLFPVAKFLMLDAASFSAGWVTAIALFRVGFLVMLERTTSQFMKGAFQVTILRHPALDGAIKGLAVLLAGTALLPSPLAAVAEGLLAILLLVRFVYWYPQFALRRLDIGVMYLGYLAIVLQLVVDVADRLLNPAWIGSVGVHVFTFGAMGLIAPALLMRISKGHTGRKVAFDATDRWALRIMMLAFVLRLVAPQLWPSFYTGWIIAAAACWCLCFALLGWRYVPFLSKPRVDGKEH